MQVGIATVAITGNLTILLKVVTLGNTCTTLVSVALALLMEIVPPVIVKLPELAEFPGAGVSPIAAEIVAEVPATRTDTSVLEPPGDADAVCNPTPPAVPVIVKLS